MTDGQFIALKLFEYVYGRCGDMDAVYEDYIKALVGEYGLELLLANKYLETCGVINGRQLYVLCKKGK